MSPRTRRRGPARQSLRVQGWLYTAINPLITALDREQQFLSSGNLTWRRFNRSTEFIQEPEGYLDANGETNLEDCLDDHPKIREALEHHAQLLREAIVAAGVAYDLLMESPPFAAAVRAGQQKYRLQQGERSRAAIPRRAFRWPQANRQPSSFPRRTWTGIWTVAPGRSRRDP